MSKEVFTVEKLESYRNDPRIIEALGGRVLLNYDEYMEWNELPEIKTTSRTDLSESQRRRRMDARGIAFSYFYEMAESVCENKIARSYSQKAMARLPKHNYDLLVILEKDYLDVKRRAAETTTSTGAYNKLRCILGFIILEQGECRERSEAYTVNLICTRTFRLPPKNGKLSANPRPFEKSKAAILLGAYMCCTKGIQYYGLLEVAGGYNNLSGFFSYSKMGFVKDSSLINDNCFPSCDNLPMSVRLADYTNDQIIDYASGKQKLKNIRDDTGLIKLIPEEGNAGQKTAQASTAFFVNMLFQLPYYLNGTYEYDSILDKEQIIILKALESEYKKHPKDTKEVFFANKLNEFKMHSIIDFNAHAKIPRRTPSPKEEEEAGDPANPDQLKKQIGQSIKQKTTIIERLSTLFGRRSSTQQTNPLAVRPPSRSSPSRTEKVRVRPPSRSRTAKVIGDVSERMSKMAVPRMF
jgi:hypothetical protein